MMFSFEYRRIAQDRTVGRPAVTHKGFDYRPAIALIRPDLLAKLPPRPGDQLHLWTEDDQQQRAAITRAARLRTARRRRTQ